MSVFEIKVVQEARCTRVHLQGEPQLGQLLSLLQVLEVDSSGWPHEAVLFDLRSLHLRLTPAEQARLAAEAAQTLRRLKRIAFLAPAGAVRGGSGVEVFVSEEAALRWLEGSG